MSTIRTREQILADKVALEEQNRELEEQLAEVRAADIAKVRDDIVRLADEHGMSPSAFIREHRLDADANAKRTPAAKPARGVAPPKYINPDNAKEAWSGVGKAPAWLEQSKYERESMRVGATPKLKASPKANGVASQAPAAH